MGPQNLWNLTSSNALWDATLLGYGAGLFQGSHGNHSMPSSTALSFNLHTRVSPGLDFLPWTAQRPRSITVRISLQVPWTLFPLSLLYEGGTGKTPVLEASVSLAPDPTSLLLPVSVYTLAMSTSSCSLHSPPSNLPSPQLLLYQLVLNQLHGVVDLHDADARSKLQSLTTHLPSE